MKTTQLKKLIELRRVQIERYTRRHPEVSLIWEGLIVREFMEQRGIHDSLLGVRAFYAFKRDQVQKLGVLAAS